MGTYLVNFLLPKLGGNKYVWGVDTKTKKRDEWREKIKKMINNI